MPEPRLDAPAISVVVPVHNGGRRLPLLVEALRAQTLGRERFEVIIGDDGSTDGGTEGLATSDGWLRVTPGPRLNSYAARNRAAALARSPLLAFCDDDCTPHPRWLENGLAALAQADIAGGAVRYTVPEHPTVWTLLSIDILFDQAHAVGLGKALTANLLVRRDVFEREGGFDESLPSGGDGDFVTRCVAHGARLVVASHAVVWHPTRDHARPFLRKIWFQNRWRSVRRLRAGTRPHAMRLRWWCPIVPAGRFRRRAGRSLRLDRRRLAEYGLSVGLMDDLRALPIMYLVLPYLSGSAQLWGWWSSRRSIDAGTDGPVSSATSIGAPPKIES